MVLLEPDFLAQLPVHRLLGRFAWIYATLRKLPRVFADPFTPENLILRIDDDNGNVRAITVAVQHRDHPETYSCYDCSTEWPRCKDARPFCGSRAARVQDCARSARSALP